MTLGIYISVPFCKSKCSYCNFASGVFNADRMQGFVDRVCADIGSSRDVARSFSAELPSDVDSIYLGGGTPSTLAPAQMQQLFDSIRSRFEVCDGAEITVECAPGTISAEMLELFVRLGVERVSLGMQSFNDHETRAVGRLHTRETTLNDIDRLRQANITNINLDLIAGLPYQTAESWEESLNGVISTGVPHVSVYILEVDEDSRLGRELIAGGTRYHAHHVPDDELTADLYSTAMEKLSASGIAQYEISNFARKGFESQHNLKYWTRQPYIGFGLDAHSMLKVSADSGVKLPVDAVRFSTADELDDFQRGPGHISTPVTLLEALEEELFLGLRLNRGIVLDEICKRHSTSLAPFQSNALAEFLELGLLEEGLGRVRLTPRGRLLSNEVFGRLIAGKREVVSS